MTNGLVVMTPSSIAYSGTSASINADGSVVFSACTSLSLNGVFTGDYDNYMVTIRTSGTVDGQSPYIYLRASGVNSTTNYTTQTLAASATTVSSSRFNTQPFIVVDDSQRDGTTLYLFGPQLAQPTAGRIISASGYLNAYFYDLAWTHSASTAYDGFTFDTAGGAGITGQLTVFGFNQ
jgi:hypothetical protein